MIGEAEKVSESTGLSASVSIEISLMATIQQSVTVNHSISYFTYSTHFFLNRSRGMWLRAIAMWFKSALYSCGGLWVELSESVQWRPRLTFRLVWLRKFVRGTLDLWLSPNQVPQKLVGFQEIIMQDFVQNIFRKKCTCYQGKLLSVQVQPRSNQILHIAVKHKAKK